MFVSKKFANKYSGVGPCNCCLLKNSKRLLFRKCSCPNHGRDTNRNACGKKYPGESLCARHCPSHLSNGYQNIGTYHYKLQRTRIRSTFWNTVTFQPYSHRAICKTGWAKDEKCSINSNHVETVVSEQCSTVWHRNSLTWKYCVLQTPLPVTLNWDNELIIFNKSVVWSRQRLKQKVKVHKSQKMKICWSQWLCFIKLYNYGYEKMKKGTF